MVIFENGFVQSIHFLSHTSDILSSQFTYHNHGNGKSHIHHHHGFLETINTILKFDNDKQQQNKPKQISNSDTSIKFHLPGFFLIINDPITKTSIKFPPFFDAIFSIYMEVWLPPPKNMLMPVYA